MKNLNVIILNIIIHFTLLILILFTIGIGLLTSFSVCDVIYLVVAGASFMFNGFYLVQNLYTDKK